MDNHRVNLQAKLDQQKAVFRDTLKGLPPEAFARIAQKLEGSSNNEERFFHVLTLGEIRFLVQFGVMGFCEYMVNDLMEDKEDE